MQSKVVVTDEMKMLAKALMYRGCCIVVVLWLYCRCVVVVLSWCRCGVVLSSCFRCVGRNLAAGLCFSDKIWSMHSQFLEQSHLTFTKVRGLLSSSNMLRYVDSQ